MKSKLYTELRKQILDLTLRPGTVLDMNRLSFIYGVSRSPVRDAVNELSSEHLVDIFPQSGTVVSRINLRMAEDERFMRLYLELGALEKAGERGMGRENLMEMERLVTVMDEAFARRDIPSLIEADNAFHAEIFKAAGRDGVFRFIQESNGNYHRLRVISFMFDSLVGDVLSQHKELLETLRSGDFEKAKAQDRIHLSKLKAETESFRKAIPQYFTEE